MVQDYKKIITVLTAIDYKIKSQIDKSRNVLM